MNPQDLLYTNRFVATNEIEFSENKSTRDRINVLKTIDRPFPKRYNRNWDPIISEEVRDIVKDRYKKYKLTSICIDSRDRNCELFPNPNNYTVVLGAQFNYIESIQLIDVDLGNLFLTKTQISWFFPPNTSAEFTVDIPCGIYTTKDLANVMMNYMSMVVDNNDNIQNIFVSIDPVLNEIKIINRLQIPEIVAIQTIVTATDDVFNTVPPAGYQQNGIYILVNFEFTNMDLPLVPTNLPNVGGFSNSLFNCNEFWNGNISGNEYVDAGTVVVNGFTYHRYLLIPRLGGQILTTTFSQNIITSAAISRYLATTTDNNFVGTFDNKNLDCLVLIGEAREFAIDFENSPIMDIFAWKECEIEFGYVLSNISDNNISKEKCFNIYRDNCCCDYMFKVEPYVLLILSAPSREDGTIAGNIVKSQNLPKIAQCDCDDFKDVNNIFAKIIIGRKNKIATSILKFYETPLEKLNEIMVTFVDRNGCILDLKCDQTITLEIVEAVDVLKDTLIDSRHGEANITGIRI